MAIVNGPLHSFEAHGQLAKQLIFQRQHGRNVVKKYAVPANPQSVNQTARREIVAFLTKLWAIIPPADQASWQNCPIDPPASAYGAYVTTAMRRWTAGLGIPTFYPFTGTTVPEEPTYVDGSYNAGLYTITLNIATPGNHEGIALYQTAKTEYSETCWGEPLDLLNIIPTMATGDFTIQGRINDPAKPNLIINHLSPDGLLDVYGLLKPSDL
jgi:hypothetical protein